MITDYNLRSYYAHELRRIGGTGVDRLDCILFDAYVNMNPDQIEGGLVLFQHWAEPCWLTINCVQYDDC